MLQVTYQKRFLKDLANLPPKSRAEIEHFVFNVLPKVGSIAAAGKFEKMTGYDNCYKARFGNYRIGAFYDGKTLELKRVLNRKEIYRYFP